MKLINKKEFAKAALVENLGTFMVHVSFLSLRPKITIHPALTAQIALLLAEKITVLAKYADFADIFSNELAKVLPERTNISKHAIELVDDKQLLYRPIYSLNPI